MKHADFVIGTEFETCAGQRWRCTDVGQRSIVAIELRPELEDAWFCGPPYPVQEVVFDEHDIAAAFRSPEEAILDALTEVDRGLHPGYPHEVVNTMMEARFPDNSRRYPQPQLFRIDRVDAAGEILHPYAAESTPSGWRILLYAPFTRTFSTLPEKDFVFLPAATPQDLLSRKKSFNSSN
ncbi:hypothetical protein [Pseudoxanthomonas sp. SGT-18]|uniref:hypothetical protein n=1 Tax=Pseudoxanthomonas sp. SGT-18 TaxID=2493087 RepID=UPI000F629F36|nr:hypothetical protein [Pseudoxanthomonas sp. SGT-18]